MVKQTLVHLHHELQFRNKKEQTTDHTNLVYLKGTMLRKKTYLKGDTLYNSIYQQFLG